MCLISQSKHWGPWDLLTLSPFLIFLLLLGWPNLNELFGPTHFNPFTKSCFSSLGSPEPRRLCWVPQCWHGNTWASRGNSVLTGVSLCWAGLHVVTVQRPRWGPLLSLGSLCRQTGFPPATAPRGPCHCWGPASPWQHGFLTEGGAVWWVEAAEAEGPILGGGL